MANEVEEALDLLKALDIFCDVDYTLMHVAASQGFTSIIETVFRMDSKIVDVPTNYGETPLFKAAASGHVPVIEMLVRLGSEAIDTPNKYGCTPMFAAACRGHTSVIEALVRLGSEAVDTSDTYGETPLFEAIRSKTNECARMLRMLGAESSFLLSSPEHREIEERTRPSEEKTLEVRFRVYFARSLLDRLVKAFTSRNFDTQIKKLH